MDELDDFSEVVFAEKTSFLDTALFWINHMK